MLVCIEDECGQEFAASRSDSRYCSSACRQRAYRRRKRLLAPYGGDADRALADALDRLRDIIGVTDKGHG